MRKTLKNSRNNKKKITNHVITDIILKKWTYLITISILIIVTLSFLSIFNIIDFNFIGKTYIIILFAIMIIYVIDMIIMIIGTYFEQIMKNSRDNKKKITHKDILKILLIFCLLYTFIMFILGLLSAFSIINPRIPFLVTIFLMILVFIAAQIIMIILYKSDR